MQKSSGKRSGGQILVDQLKIQGCERIFTVPGESFLAVLDALHLEKAIETVVCRQEGGAAFMAAADGTMSQLPGIAFVTRGPGATNASIGVHVAMQDSIPMILFIGDVARGDRDREGFQEVDFPAMFAPLAKWAARIEDARRIPEYLARAWNVAISGRPGPVVLALPEDMLRDQLVTADRPPISAPVQRADPQAMAEMVKMLGKATNPVAIIGGAGWNARARANFQSFAERIGLPVATAFRRQDAIASDSAVYAGNLGYGPNPQLIERIKNADLVIAVGARLGEATTNGYELITPDHPDCQLIHVHPDPNELGRVYRTDLAICADMASFAHQAVEINRSLPYHNGGAEAHKQWLQWSDPEQVSSDAALDLAKVVAEMRSKLPEDTIICNGAGNFSGWWHRFWHYGALPSQLAPTAGAMGYGVPAAVAASLRFPDRMVVAVAGDGDFLMNGQELATAVQYDCNMLVLVVDNGTYGTIRMHQERDYPERQSATALRNPDFAALARSFGGWAATVETSDGFAPALDEAMKVKGLRLLHLKTDIEYIAASGLTISAMQKVTD